ncbi:hypothetical protein AB0M12_21820 [Nocardia vinacea]|uniref:hypothetical protein n=1 Tax=Nocardia vinacea TaxID=96468 RepID=UPI003433C078
MRDKQSTGRSEIAALAERVANARGRLPLQDDAALVQALSDAEIDAERELAQWVRAQRRGQRKRAVQDELAAEKRNRRTVSAIQRADDADARWHRRALAARRRVSNQDARLAQLYRRAEWSSRALIAVVVLGMVWAGVNVQHNLVPSGNMADPLYWLSYGIEAMISIPIITIMVAATTAARWGRELDRGKVVFFETALLGTTVALNAGPHLAAGSFGQAAEYAIAPVMVGVVIWLHAWVSARYALLIDSVPVVEDEPDLPPRHRVTTERGAPIDTFRDDPTDRRELLAAKGFDPLLDQAGVRFPVDMDPHLTEAAMRAAQPESVPVSRLDCTETLVYHAQSTRSTNGRLTQQIPNEDYRSGHSAHGSDSIHTTARTLTDANGTRPAHASATAANTFGENASHAADVDQRIAPGAAASAGQRSPHATVHVESATAQVNTPDAHTTIAPAGFDSRTAVTATDERAAANIGTTSATTASARDEAMASEKSGDAGTAPAAADHAAFSASGIDVRTVTPADSSTQGERTAPGATGVEREATTAASVRDERSTRDASTTSLGGEVESQKAAARPAQSQLSIFDTATVEPARQSSDDTAHTPRGRAQADTSRATVSRTTGTVADAPRPAKSSVRTETSTRTSAPAEPQSATRDSSTPTPAERITRAMEVHLPSSADNNATDHEAQTAASEVEGRQLVPDDAPRRTTSEVISEVVQSLSAEDLLTENLGSESDDVEVWSVARAIAGRGLSVIPVEQLAEILMLADQSWTPTSIGAEVGLSRTAIAQVLEFARRVRRPYAISS